MSIQKLSCYVPNGTAIPDWSPCRDADPSTGEATFCCALDSGVCTSNGYCVGSAGVFYRGGCTDPNWSFQGCPQLCQKVATDGFANFYPCQAGVFSHNNWICGDTGIVNPNLCDDSSNLITFDPGLPFDPKKKALSSVSVPITTIITSGGAPTTSAKSIPSPSGNASCPAISYHSSQKNVGLEVGLSVGLALSIVIAILSMLLVRERKQKKIAMNGSEQVKRENIGLYRGWSQWPVWKKSVYEADSAPYMAEAGGRPADGR